MVFQDRNWTARPWTILEEDVQSAGDSFIVELRARGSFDAEPFTWTGRLTGSPDGTIRYSVDGSPDAPFLRNRLGLCVLHPADLAGRPATVETVGGVVVETAFPLAISPDQPFADMRALTHEVAPGLRVTVRMTGETFESEDHRNWSDASFKHYCTPISLPFPVTVNPGERITQAVEVTLDGAVPVEPWSPPDLRIDLTDDELTLPRIGVQLDHDGHRLTSEEIQRLAALRLAHVRVDIDTSSPAALPRLEAALQDAEAIGALLVPALHVTDTADLARLSPWADDVRIDHWIVLDPAAKVTGPDLVAAAVAVVGQRVGGGTDLYFTELNRGRPRATPFVAFSINPQVHASDDQSVMQNAVTQSTIARNARALYPDAWLEASPITLRPEVQPQRDRARARPQQHIPAEPGGCAPVHGLRRSLDGAVPQGDRRGGGTRCRHLLRGDRLGGAHGARRGIGAACGLPVDGRRRVPRVRRVRRAGGGDHRPHLPLHRPCARRCPGPGRRHDPRRQRDGDRAGRRCAGPQHHRRPLLRGAAAQPPEGIVMSTELFSLSGRNVLITGAGGVIGTELAARDGRGRRSHRRPGPDPGAG